MFIASIMARGKPSTSRSMPAPNKASMTISQSVSATGEACSSGPLQRSAAMAASPSAARSPTADATVQRSADGAPRQNRRRHCCQGHAITTRRPGSTLGTYRASGILHQLDAGNAAFDRKAIGLGHFRAGKEFDHGSPRLSANLNADNSG
jgi:hypothetical protein